MKFRLHYLVAALFLAGCASLQAQFLWTGSSTVNGSIFDSNNWQSVTGAPVGTSGTEGLQFSTIVGTQTDILVPTSSFATFAFSGSSRPAYTVSGTGATPVLTLNVNLTASSGNNVTFDNTLGISLSSGAHLVDVASGTIMQINGNINGAGSLSAIDTGALVLAGTNTYTGGTTVDLGGNLGVTGSISHSGANTVVGVTAGATNTLAIAAGGQVSDNLGRIGLTGNTTFGAVTVDGVGSSWTNATYLYVGELGNATLAITNGATVTTPNTSIGNNAGGNGIVTVDGAGSSLVNTSNLYVGSAGTGSLSITNGGHVASVAGSIGNNTGGSGSVNISGVGSVWTNTGDIYVADAGTTGSMSVYSGGVVNSANGYVATLAATTGYAYADGAGTAWNLTNALYVGFGGSGVFTLNDGAALNVAGGNGTIFLGFNAGSLGQFLIGSEGGPGGIVNASAITTMNGTGDLDFQTSTTAASPYYLTKDGTSTGVPVVISGATSVSVAGGYNVLAGNNTYSNGTFISFGTLVAGSNNALGTGSVSFSNSQATLNVASGVTITNALNLANGGTLAGNGTIGTAVSVGPSVVLAPGNSPGALTFSNGLTLAGGGTLNFEVEVAGGVAGTGYDLVNVSGGPFSITANNSLPFTISVQSLNASGASGNVADFSSSSNYAWTIFSVPGGITGFSPADFVIDTTGFTNNLGIGSFYVTQAGNQIQLDFTAVPEPSTYALFATGLGLVGVTLRRRRSARG